MTPHAQSNKTITANRDHAIDNLKGFLIILVVLGHGGLLTSLKNPVANFFQGYIYLFHMALFFAVSSLFVKEFSWKFARKRFIQLMVPYYFFVIIDPVHVGYHLLSPGTSATPLLFNLSASEFIKQVFIGSGYYLQSPLWFLPALFVSNILFSILYKYRANKLVIISYSVLFCVVLYFSNQIQEKHYHIPYGVDIAIYIMPILGLLHYLYSKRIAFLAKPIYLYLGGILISSVLIFLFVPKKNPFQPSGRFNLDQFYVPGTMWGYSLICLLTISIFLVFLNFNKSTILSTIGLYTMPIFILHTYPWFQPLFKLPGYVCLVVMPVCAVVVSIGISKLLMKISPKFSWIGMVA